MKLAFTADSGWVNMVLVNPIVSAASRLELTPKRNDSQIVD
jgi:hypothetical protein